MLYLLSTQHHHFTPIRMERKQFMQVQHTAREQGMTLNQLLKIMLQRGVLPPTILVRT